MEMSIIACDIAFNRALVRNSSYIILSFHSDTSRHTQTYTDTHIPSHREQTALDYNSLLGSTLYYILLCCKVEGGVIQAI